MPSARALSADLARQLSGVVAPICVLSDRRRVVYANGAMCQWLGLEQDQLIGRTCGYHSSPVADPIELRIAGLCPPPEVFSGARIHGAVSRLDGDGQIARRGAEFFPLPDDSENWSAVLVIAEIADHEPSQAIDRSGERLAAVDGSGTSGAPAGIENAAISSEAAALHSRLQHLHRQLKSHWQMDRLFGDSPAMRRVRAQAVLAASSAANVLIVGPPGSGRRHVAKAIHYGQATSTPGNLMPLEGATLSVDLLATSLAELAAAAPSLASSPASPSAAEGTFSTAQVTLLLLDVLAMPVEAQAELSRRQAQQSRPRIIATATGALDSAADRGEFRRDLACELSTITIHLPPLSQRREDIPLLAQMFVEELNVTAEKQLGGFSPEALDQLAAYPWPGNIDELATMVREACAKAEGAYVTPGDLPKRIYLAAAAQRTPRRAIAPVEIDRVLGEIEIELIRRAMRLAKGNKTKAAKLLGLTRPRLYRRMVQLGLEQRKPT